MPVEPTEETKLTYIWCWECGNPVQCVVGTEMERTKICNACFWRQRKERK